MNESFVLILFLLTQVDAKAGKQSRNEKKARKIFSKLGLKPVRSLSY